jgi:exodeoxyribonuclease VII large subunit
MRLESIEKRLRALGPEATLARGFSIVTNASGDVVRRAEQVAAGDAVRVLLHHGKIEARVEGVDPGEN